jgi:predicted ATPase
VKNSIREQTIQKMKTKPQLIAIQAQGYRNLEMTTPFELENLNILIGENGVGKSNLLEMIEFLSDALSKGLAETFKKRRSLTSVIHLDKSLPSEIAFVWQLNGNPFSNHEHELIYRLIIEGDNYGRFSVKKEILEDLNSQNSPYLNFEYGEGNSLPWLNGPYSVLGQSTRSAQNLKNPQKTINVSINRAEKLKNAQQLALGTLSSPQLYPVLEYVREQALSWHFYNANDMDVRAIKREALEIDALQQTLAPNGCNLGLVLFNLMNSEDSEFGENLERILLSLYPNHRRYGFRLVDSTHFELRWQFDNFRKPLKFDQVSDGTIRMLCWITVLAHPNPPALVCIDEPELGIHPAWLPILATLIQEAAESTQVIISTHSPILLDEFTHQADKVIVCTQNEQGQAIFERLDAEVLEDWLAHYRLGKMFSAGHPELGGLSR